jgi:hypothetical protein
VRFIDASESIVQRDVWVRSVDAEDVKLLNVNFFESLLCVSENSFFVGCARDKASRDLCVDGELHALLLVPDDCF